MIDVEKKDVFVCVADFVFFACFLFFFSLRVAVGIDFRRSESLNNSPLIIRAQADIVVRFLSPLLFCLFLLCNTD